MFHLTLQLHFRIGLSLHSVKFSAWLCVFCNQVVGECLSRRRILFDYYVCLDILTIRSGNFGRGFKNIT